jgi:tetratricopeptide (TPR) repeat protein
VFSRLLLAGLLLCPCFGAQQTPPGQAEPPEEDESLVPKEYAFNPVQAANEVKVGSYYFKKGSYTAAKLRFEEALKWNPGYAEAYLRLGEACEKLKRPEEARQAYEKYLELQPTGKDAERLRKKLAAKPK